MSSNYEYGSSTGNGRGYASRNNNYGSDPFGANDGDNPRNDRAAPVVAAMAPELGGSFPAAAARYGRPAAREIHSDSDYSGVSAGRRSNSPPIAAAAYGQPKDASAYDNSQSDLNPQQQWFGGDAALALAHNQPSGSRAVSDHHRHHRSGVSSSTAALNRTVTDYVRSSTNGLGVGVGVADSSNSGSGDLGAYPSLRSNSGSGSTSGPGAFSEDAPPAARFGSTGPSTRMPPKKEATPIMPPSLTTEPPLGRARISRRFLSYHKPLSRQPDLAIGSSVKNARFKPSASNLSSGFDRHVLKCPKCQSFLKIPKMAVLMKCPTCSTVSPATSSSN